MNDLIFITHCCFTSHKSLQMEITADNINVSRDEPQTFLCVFNAGKRDNEVTTPFCRTSQKKKKKKEWKQS